MAPKTTPSPIIDKDKNFHAYDKHIILHMLSQFCGSVIILMLLTVRRIRNSYRKKPLQNNQYVAKGLTGRNINIFYREQISLNCQHFC